MPAVMRALRIVCLFVSAWACLAAPNALAETEPPVFSTLEGAIRGYDPVAYFTKKKPTKGDKKHQFVWRGATWSFANAANLERFRNDPIRYAPQYGGYCAYAMSKGSYASIDPLAWTIHDGKLYLNFSVSVRDRWRQAIGPNIERADRNWRRLHPGL